MEVGEARQFKKCMKCKELLPLTSFNKNRTKPDGLGSECRPCANAHSKKYHAENHSAHVERGRAAYRADPDSFKKRARKWETENADRKKELRAKYRKRNAEKVREFSRLDWLRHNPKRLASKALYRKKFPEKAAAQVRMRQARKVQAMPTWANQARIEEFYKSARDMTVLTGIQHHVDHIIPLRGKLVCGLHNEFNLQVLPAAVNQAKSNKLVEF